MNITLSPGTLYIDGAPLVPVYKVDEAPELEPAQDWPKDNPYIKTNEAFAELSFSARIAADAWARLCGVTDMVLNACRVRRVVHLAQHAKKRRTHKKNLHRAFRILEKEADK